MPANNAPIYPLTPHIGFGKVLTANTATDGTGTTVSIFTAGSNGSRIDSIEVVHLGTNVVGVCRIFVNNGSAVGTAANNALVYEFTMAANTISQVASSVPATAYPSSTTFSFLPLVLPAGYVIYASCGTTVVAGYMVIVQGGDF